MYKIISAIGQPSAPASAWEAVSVLGKSASALYSEYSDIYLRISNPFWDADRTVLLSAIRHLIKDTSQTLTEFFTSLGSQAVAAVQGIASIITGAVTYSDAYYAGYKLARARYDYSPGFVPEHSDSDTLVMTKAGVDPRHFQKHCLVSVNGLFHRVDADSNYVYVHQAAKSLNHCFRNEVGVMSFSKVGALETVSITEQMLSRAHPDQPYANQIIITSPVKPGKRTAALVFGGYLMVLDNLSFLRCSEDSFVLDVQNIPLVSRYFESLKRINMDFLELETAGASHMQISRAQLYSDETLTKWLTHSLSFLVFIDTDNLEVERVQLPVSRSSGSYVTDKEPTQLICYGTGLAPAYWKQRDEGRWSISMMDNLHADYLSDTTPAALAPMPSDNNRSYAAQSYRRAFLTSITTQKVVLS